jgi:hypothetical protein
MLESIRGYFSQERMEGVSHLYHNAVGHVRQQYRQWIRNPQGLLSQTIAKVKAAYNTAKTWFVDRLVQGQVWEKVVGFARRLYAAIIPQSPAALHAARVPQPVVPQRVPPIANPVLHS